MSEAVEELTYKIGEIVDVPIVELHNNPWNPRRISEAQLESLKASISEDKTGLRDRPLIALPNYTVIAGNMRLTAARALGWDTIPTVFRDYTEAQARVVALRDNNPWGDWDDGLLAPLLRELEDQEVSLDLTGFTIDRLDSLRVLGEDPQPPPPDERGSHLAISDVTIGDPTHIVSRGEVWTLGHHRLVCAPVFDGWKTWARFLEGNVMFVPYPTPTVPLTEKAQEIPLLLVQPDEWMAGHLVDKYAAVHGEGTVQIVEPTE